MKRAFIIISAFACIAAFTDARGQSTLNATGGTHTIGSTMFDWSIGEISLVSTFYNTGANIILTQGVLQNETSIKVSVVNPSISQNLQVFPNPASSFVNIQFASPKTGTLNYRLMDMTGKVIMNHSSDINVGTFTEQVNISDLAVAAYLLEISFKSGSDKEEITSYKIEKLK